MANKTIYILGGGTFSHVRSHLSVAAPAFGGTAKRIHTLIQNDLERFGNFDKKLMLTKMADSDSNVVENEDVAIIVDTIIQDASAKIVFMNMALCDFEGTIGNTPSGKYADRLRTVEGEQNIALTPAAKLIGKIRERRKDIFVVGFKTTCNETKAVMFERGLDLLKSNSLNLVLANDIGTRTNMIITPEEGSYLCENREDALNQLVDMAWHRSHLSFTRSTVVDGKAVAWADHRVFPTLRTVVDWCVSKNAYKAFNGVTTGHFAAKISETEFLTSIRKTNFNDLAKNGLVHVKTDGPGKVIATGFKPSVGGQSQRIIFQHFDDTDCIVHFHCPLKKTPKDDIQVMSQKEYECGSHECGENTRNGLRRHGNLYAVMLDKHGPNIVFNHNIDPQEVIDFIENNFDMDKSTSGYTKVFM